MLKECAVFESFLVNEELWSRIGYHYGRTKALKNVLNVLFPSPKLEICVGTGKEDERRRRESPGGLGACSPRKFWNLEALKFHFRKPFQVFTWSWWWFFKGAYDSVPKTPPTASLAAALATAMVSNKHLADVTPPNWFVGRCAGLGDRISLFPRLPPP